MIAYVTFNCKFLVISYKIVDFYKKIALTLV